MAHTKLVGNTAFLWQAYVLATAYRHLLFKCEQYESEGASNMPCQVYILCYCVLLH